MNISHSSKETFQIAFLLLRESKYLKLILRDEKEQNVQIFHLLQNSNLNSQRQEFLVKTLNNKILFDRK